MEHFTHIVARLVAFASGKAEAEITPLVEFPPEAQKGDRALPCHRWAKTEQKSPQEIASSWKEAIVSKGLPPEIDRVEAVAGFLNFFIKRRVLAESVLFDISKNPGRFGFVTHEKAPVAVIEFSSPNIAKPFSIGHLRSTNIGAALSRIFQARGWRVIKINHLGDWGTQFGKLISSYRRWGSAELLKDEPILNLYKLYVRWHEQEVSDPTLIEEAREWFSKLERGDEEATELWKWFRELTLMELKRLYEDLGVEFDHYWGESFYSDQLSDVLNDLEIKGITKVSDDATIVDLEEHGLATCVVKKSNDSSLYLTRDLAAAIYRHDHLKFDRMIYVVGAPQKLHFQQLFKILELKGHSWAASCEHIPFGHISFGDEAMSTRKGNVVFLSEVMERAEEMAAKIVAEKNAELENKEEIAKAVGRGAILFADLGSKRVKDVRFSWEEVLSFDGETGPYIQYALVRMRSLLRRMESPPEPFIGEGMLEADEEAVVVRHLSQFPVLLEKVERDREPFLLAQYLVALVKLFNRFYTVHRVLDAAPEVTRSRMFLVACSADVLKTGMDLLGLPTPEKM